MYQVTAPIPVATWGPTRFSVWVKPTWAGEWVLLPFVDAEELRGTVSPDLSTGAFLWRYGYIWWSEVGAWMLHTPYDLQNWYIAVFGHRAEGTWPEWIGVVETQSFEPFGWHTGGGDQHFQAYGLEYLLDRRRIYGAWVEAGDTQIMRTPVLNQRYEFGLSNAGNRSDAEGSQGVYTFSKDGNEWTATQFIEYVLKYYTSDTVPFTLTGDLTVLDQIKPRFNFEGKTPREILNHFCDQKRGLCYRIITTGAGAVNIEVMTELSQPLVIDSVQIPANQNQAELEFGNSLNARPRVVLSGLHKYDSIIVASEEPIKAVFTASFANGRLEKGWTDDEEAAYLAATDKQRTSDAFARVFTTFRIAQDWDWAGVAPVVAEDGTVSTATTGAVWPVGKKIERQLPLPETATITGAEPSQRQLAVWVKHKDAYHYSDAISTLRSVSIQPVPLDRELAVRLRAPGGNHLLALNHWTGAAESKVKPVMDYEDIVITCMVETDQRLSVTQPLWDGRATEVGKALYITVPGIEYWFVAASTVEDVEEGVLTNYTGSAVLRNDADKLKAIAASALAWYGQVSAGLEYELDDVLPIHWPGTIINGIDAGWAIQPVGSIVTERTVNCARQSMSVRTGYRQFDERAQTLGDMTA